MQLKFITSMKKNLKKHKTIIRSLATPKKSVDMVWAVKIVIFALAATFLLSYFSNETLDNVSIVSAFFILLLFILIGVIFDIIGIAVTAADQKPFHSMAAKKVLGAKYAIKIIRNANKVSNFCNDVVGDIAGIVSGGTVIVIVAHLSKGFSWAQNTVLFNLILASVVAAVTIGGKAIGKSIAINYCNTIVYYVGVICESVVGFFDPQSLNRQSKNKNQQN